MFRRNEAIQIHNELRHAFSSVLDGESCEKRLRTTMKDYSDHVAHPRYGQAPQSTGFDPNPNSPDVHLHWNTPYPRTKGQLRLIERLLGTPWSFPNDGTQMICGTAIVADLYRQTPGTMPVTHYYDLDKVCRDCARRFIFFAEEQKHWYEELGFPLEADAVRCPLCRKQVQVTRRKRARYERLFHLPFPTVAESMEMADCSLTLIEEGIFHYRQTQHVRMLLNRVRDERNLDARFINLTARLHAVETGAKDVESEK